MADFAFFTYPKTTWPLGKKLVRLRWYISTCSVDQMFAFVTNNSFFILRYSHLTFSSFWVAFFSFSTMASLAHPWSYKLSQQLGTTTGYSPCKIWNPLLPVESWTDQGPTLLFNPLRRLERFYRLHHQFVDRKYY